MSWVKHISILVVLLLCLHYNSISKEFKHFGVDEGMPSSTVYSIQQDSSGLMWFGTNAGLVSFDGVNYTNYDLSEFSSESNFVNEIVIDNNNRFWIGTSKGLFWYDNLKDKVRRVSSKHEILKVLNIRKLIFNRNGNIWIGSNRSVFIYNLEKDFLKRLDDNSITFDLLHYDDSHILISNENGLRIFDVSSLKEIPVFPALKKFQHKQIQKLNRTNSGNIIMFSVDEGIHEYNPSTGKVTEITTINKLLRAQTMLRDVVNLDDNNILFAFDGFGILHTDREYNIIDHYKQDEDLVTSLKNDGVYDIFIDKEKRIWVATYGGGVNMNDPFILPFQHYYHIPYNKNSISNNTGNCVAQDSDGKIWFGTKKGISIFNQENNTWKHLNNEQGKILGNNTILTICQINDDEMWVGSYGGGIDVINTHNYQTRPLIPLSDIEGQLGSSFVFEIKKIENEVWLGLIRGRLTKYNLADHTVISFPITDIKLIYPIDPKLLFLAGADGFYLFDRETGDYEHFQHQESVDIGLTSNYVRCVLPLADKLYIGTEGGGFISYNTTTKEFKNYTINNGLPSKSILAILRDSRDYLWLSTRNGISRFNPFDKSFVNFNNSDGLPFNEYFEKSAIILQNQDLIFGGANGFIQFSPAKINKTSVTKPVILTSLKISNKLVTVDNGLGILKNCLNFTKDLFIKYNQNSFSISFASINYVNPGSDKFHWFLTGNDIEWSDISTQNSASFTNIPSGDYLFKVYVENGNEEGGVKAINIHIAPPFLRSTWAYLIYLIFLGIIVTVAIYLIRLRYHEKTARDKNEFFVNVAHDLRTPLTLIKLPLTSLAENKNIKNTESELIKLAIRNLDKLHSYFNQLMDFQKASQNKLQLILTRNDLSSHIKNAIESFMPLIEIKGIKVEENIQDEIITFYDKTKFDKIFYNLLSNAIKYSFEGGTIYIESFIRKNKSVIIRIKDNGIGIPGNQQKNIFKQYFRAANAINSSEIGSGLGLMLVKQLVELHNGNISFFSQPGKGTAFELKLPLINKPEFEIEEGISEDIEIFKKRGKKDAESILVVEDNLEIQEQLASLLSQKYEVITAGNGKEGLELTKKLHPDLIISDIMMPVMDGNTLCIKLKTDFETSHIPVILLTALTGPEYEVDGYRSGADAYIEKPFDYSVLEARIINLLKSRKKLQEKFSQPDKQIGKIDYSTKVDNDFMKRAIELVEENIQDPEFSVEEFCKAIFKSRPVVYRKLKALTNKSPQDFIKHIRMQKALELLTSTNFNINEVAFRVGFTDQRYFSTSFKKVFGVSPSYYLKK